MRRLRESLAKEGKPWQPSRIDRRGRDSQEGCAADRIIHEILITEFLLALWQTVDRRPDLELMTVQRLGSLAKHPAFRVTVGRRSTRLVPDAMFLFRQRDCGLCCCFLELDNGTMNRKQLEAKFGRYAAWAKLDLGRAFLIDLYRRHGATEPRPTFRLLMVARSRTGQNDSTRAAELSKGTSQARIVIRDRVWLTTVDALRDRQHDKHPLSANIWLRARDLERLSDSGSLQKQIANTSRHALFPTEVPSRELVGRS